MWIGAVALVGGLAALRRGWRQQVADAVGCLAALGVAWWQYPRLLPHIHLVWPTLAIPQVTMVYLFAALYGLWHILVSLYIPDNQRPEPTRWMVGLIGAAQAGVLALLAVLFLPHV